MKEPSSAYKVSYNEVDNTNFNSYFSQIIKKLNVCSHIALDLEFTALAHVKTSDYTHRYVAMKQVVENATIAEIGLSVVKHIDCNVKQKIKTQPPPLKSSVSDLTHLVGDAHIEEEKETWFPSTQPLPTTTSSSLFEPLFSVQSSNTAEAESTTTTAAISKQENSNEEEETSYFVQKYECDNFSLLTLNQGKFQIDASTGSFLVKHGYSFDRLFQDGILFTPFCQDLGDPENGPIVDRRLKNLWKHMMGVMRFHHVPLVLHNGLYDLMYIYHSFIGELPDSLSAFIVKVSDAFPSGIYDTRYLAEQADFSATFLPYVFAKADRMRQNRFMKSTLQRPYFEVEVKPPLLPTGVKRKRAVQEEKEAYHPTILVNQNGQLIVQGRKKATYCIKFADHGYCDNKDHNPLHPLHDIQLILDEQMGASPYTQVYQSKSSQMLYGAHAAHFDAYMTAFSYCYFRNTLSAGVLKSSLNKMKLSHNKHPLTFPIKKTHHPPPPPLPTPLCTTAKSMIEMRSTQ